MILKKKWKNKSKIFKKATKDSKNRILFNREKLNKPGRISWKKGPGVSKK